MQFDQILAAAASQGGGALTYDTDAASYFAAVVTAGGAAVTGPRKALINTFIVAEKVAGTWALTDDYWMLAAETATQALVSLKQRRTATATATFAADQGYTGNGSSTFVDTGFVPTTHGVALTLTSARLAMYISTTGRIGAQTTVATERLQFGRIGGAQISMGVSCDLLSGTGGGFASPVGLISASRNGSTWTGYRRGVSVETVAPTPGTALPGVSIYIGAVNNNGTFATGSTTQHRFVCVGGAMTTAQELSQYNNVHAHMTAIGANL